MKTISNRNDNYDIPESFYHIHSCKTNNNITVSVKRTNRVKWIYLNGHDLWRGVFRIVNCVVTTTAKLQLLIIITVKIRIWMSSHSLQHQKEKTTNERRLKISIEFEWRWGFWRNSNFTRSKNLIDPYTVEWKFS